MIRHFFTKQFLKFLFVGATAALINWISRMVFGFWMSFSMSVVVAYLAGMTSAFCLNRRFVFPDSNRPVQKQIRDFVLTNLVAFPLVWIMSIQLNKLLIEFGFTTYSESLAHLVALSLPTVVSFLIYKFFTFGEE